MGIDKATLQRLQGKKVLVIGDVMLDTYLLGDAQRISPEAPVPVVHIQKEQHMLGGAGNVARNITALGGKAALFSLVGCDAPGRQVETMLEEAGIDPCLIRSPERPTTVKTRIMARNQQMIRLDREQIGKPESQVFQSFLPQLQALATGYEVIILSDYGKGMVHEELIAQLRKIMPEARIFIDPKPQNKALYRNAYMLTPNAAETSAATGMPVSKRDEVLLAGKALQKELQLSYLLTTLGADGMALFEPQGKVWHLPTAARQVFDVSGAGDTVIATLALACSAGFDPLQACVLANAAAGIVVGKVGAATASCEELAQYPGAQPELWQK